MAIVNGMWLKGSKKKLGGTVVYESGGRTIQRVLAPEVRNPRTIAQMSVRVRWANIVNLYKALKPIMKYAFENKKRYQSDYNMLMSLNVSKSTIFLTKQEAEQGACVVSEYDITRGSLPRITYENNGIGLVTSNIAMGTKEDITNMTIAKFSQKILNNNGQFREGDQLSFVGLWQSTDDTTGIPFVVLEKNEVILDTTNNDYLKNYFDVSIIYIDDTTGKNVLVFDMTTGAGAGTFIHSRTVSGKTYVSSQNLVATKMAGLISSYSSEKQYQNAIDSYGASEDAFLDSQKSEYNTNVTITDALLYMKIGNTIYRPGAANVQCKYIAGQDVELVFNRVVEGGTWQGLAHFFLEEDKTIQLTNFDEKGEIVTAKFGNNTDISDFAQLRYIEIEDGGQEFQIAFNYSSSGGLE